MGKYKHILKLSVILFWLGFAGQGLAQDNPAFRGEVGSFTNDFFGDGHDRWRTGSYQRSYISQGYQFSGIDSLEVRWRTDIVTPWAPSNQPGGDLPLSTLLGAGAYIHGHALGFDIRAGGEVLLLGEDTGLDTLQQAAHDIMGMDDSFDSSKASVYLGEEGLKTRFDVEVARPLRYGDSVMLRPYGVLVAGVDQSATLGADVVVGPMAAARIWTRDVVTGRLLTPEVSNIGGYSFVLGWDASAVEASVHIPDFAAVDIEPNQFRGRAGVQFRTDLADLFLGQAWLSESFQGQVEPQRVGLLSVAFAF